MMEEIDTPAEMYEYVMYILVNTDLKMDKGKIAAQVGHVTEMIAGKMYVDKLNNSIFENYCKYIHNGRKKVVLKATQSQLEAVMNDLDAVYVIDAGRTQIPSGSMTVVGFYPSNLNKERFKDFKLQ
jgi:peptidyl-tRNA hydrolase, PTH2 family